MSTFKGETTTHWGAPPSNRTVSGVQMPRLRFKFAASRMFLRTKL